MPTANVTDPTRWNHWYQLAMRAARPDHPIVRDSWDALWWALNR